MEDKNILTGLTEPQAEAARRRYGTNALPAGPAAGFLRQIWAALGDPIIKLLLLALGAELLFSLRSMQWFETVGIALAVLLATLISAASEYGSEKAFRRLRQESGALRCKVRRGGALRELPADDLVMGDLVLLEAGDKVPADGALRQGALAVDQSALTGESREMKKRPGGPDRVWDPAAPAQLFRGTVVTEGRGVLEVQRLGPDSFFGQTAARLREEPPASPLRDRLTALADRLAKIGWAAALLVAGVVLLTSHRSGADLWLSAALTALTLLVVAVPEGLPMMITVALSANMARMKRDRVLVRKPVGVETAGSMELLFTDKTGTLTTGKITAEGLLTPAGEFLTPARLAARPDLARLVALSGRYNSSSEPGPGGRPVGGNATDRALLALALRLPAVSDRRLAFQPFSSDAKRSSCTLETAGAFVKGAPEQLLPRCKNGGGKALRQALAARTGEGARAVALCTGEGAALELIGVALLRDPLRPRVRQSVERLRGAGVTVVMLTGDGPDTAAAIASRCGILRQPGEVLLTGAQLEALSEEELLALLPRLRVVSRALPAHKSRLVRAAQSLGLVCGMTGDGVNDAAALRAADVGFAMGSGTEVAKDAGDLILLDDDLAAICAAVLYGRTVFRSIRRFLVFQLTLNFTALAISLLGPVLGVEAPVTMVQMLWLNLIMDTLAGLAFSGELPRDRYLQQPPIPRTQPVLTRQMAGQIGAMAGYMTALCAGFLLWARPWFRDEASFLTGFFTLFVFAGLLNSLNARTDRRDITAGLAKNPAFALMALAGVVQLVLIFRGGPVFRCVPLTGQELARTAALAATVLPADLLRKTVEKARRGRAK